MIPPREAASGNERMLGRYVLGQLTGAELESLEDRLLADPTLFEEMEAIEAELCDDYAAGQLTAEDRAAFEARLPGQERLQRKVAFARALAAAPPAPGRSGDAPWQWWAIAAALIVVIAGAWWFTRSRTVPDTVNVARTPEPSPSPPAPATTPAPAPTGVLRPTPSVPAVVATLALFGPVIRDPGAAPVLAIPGAPGLARLEVALQDGDVFPGYRMSVTRGAGGDVWNGDGLRAVNTPGGRVLRADIAVDALPEGTYQVSVYGVPAGDASPARLSSYVFRVTRARPPGEMF